MAAGSALDQLELSCRRETMAYEAWLRMLTPLRRFCLAGSGVFSAAAGVSVFWDGHRYGRAISAGLAFAATALTVVHTVLKCDEHQAECRRLIQAFKSIQIQIPECRELEAAEHAEAQHKLTAKLANLIESTHACPSASCYRQVDEVLAGRKR